jgi:hypothetical protein
MATGLGECNSECFGSVFVSAEAVLPDDATECTQRMLF